MKLNWMPEVFQTGFNPSSVSQSYFHGVDRCGKYAATVYGMNQDWHIRHSNTIYASKIEAMTDAEIIAEESGKFVSV